MSSESLIKFLTLGSNMNCPLLDAIHERGIKTNRYLINCKIVTLILVAERK